MSDAEKREHVWVPMPEVDSYRCQMCGLVVTTTSLGTGIITKHGLIVTYCTPDSSKPDLDEEFGRLLAGEYDDDG